MLIHILDRICSNLMLFFFENFQTAHDFLMIFPYFYFLIFSAARSWWRWDPDSCRGFFDADKIFSLPRAHWHPAKWGVPVQVLHAYLVLQIILLFHVLPVSLMSFLCVFFCRWVNDLVILYSVWGPQCTFDWKALSWTQNNVGKNVTK